MLKTFYINLDTSQQRNARMVDQLQALGLPFERIAAVNGATLSQQQKSLVDEEIRNGLSQLFHQAKSDLDEAQQDIINHQQMVEEAQNRLMNSPAEDFQKYRHEWIHHVNTVIEDEERVKKSKKQLEAIKRVYKLEFG